MPLRVPTVATAISVMLVAPALADTASRVKRGDFDARAGIPCAQERGEALGLCDAGVVRADGGATVVVTFPNGFARTLRFAGSRFDRANPTMSGTGRDTDWTLRNGVHRIRVDDQRFELPDAFVSGD